jgi:hypothetical protein
MLNYALRRERVWVSGCIGPRFLDLGIIVVCFERKQKYYEEGRKSALHVGMAHGPFHSIV